MILDRIRAQLAGPGPKHLVNARFPKSMAPDGLPSAGDGLVGAEVFLEGGALRIYRPGECPVVPEACVVDLKQSMVWALPVDCHTHVDKGQVWARTPNPDGSFPLALEASGAETQAHFSEADMRVRSSFILDCAVAHGTAAVRTHVDASRDHLDTRLGVLQEFSAQYSDRINLQLAPFTGLGEAPEVVDYVAERAAAVDASALSAFLYKDARLDEFLDQIFRLALKYGLALDFHADETLDPDSHCTRAVAEAALRHRFDAPILVGHACALAVQPPAVLDRTLDLVAEAGISIVALPLCNSYLQDRHAVASPRYRGVAPIRDMAARGIPVCLASDNVRDPFHAYGDMDLTEVFRFAMVAMHLDHPVGDWPATIAGNAARAMGVSDVGRLAADGAANLMILPARNWSEFGARPLERIVIRKGSVQGSRPPDFARLDELKGMDP